VYLTARFRRTTADTLSTILDWQSSSNGALLTNTQATAPIDHGAANNGDLRRSWWQAGAVLSAAVLILVAATLAGSAIAQQFDAWADIDTPRAYRAGALEALSTARLGVFLATFQAVALGLTLMASRLFGGNHIQLMGLMLPPAGAASVLKFVVGLIVLAAIYASAVFAVDHGALLGDVKPFAAMMQADTWWMVLMAAAIGAPIAEETLFRGLMYGVMRASPVGAIGGALVTALVWASVHAQYSVYGLGAIFLIGLYLAWVREKTGSIVTPILCHGVYNGMIVLALMLAPETAFQAV
jgi:uncharacterized protein